MHLALFILLAVQGVRAADPETRDLTLKDGTHVVGVLIFADQNGYLVQTSTGNRLVPLDAILHMDPVASAARPTQVEAPALAPLPPPPSDYVSVDGFRFSTAEAKSTYEIRRCKPDVLDARSGAWRQDSETTITPLSVVGTSVSSTGTGQYSDTVIAQYRISTGEGVVLATFSGPMLYQSKRLFGYLGQLDVWNRHSHAEGASEEVRRARRVMEFASAGVLATGILVDVGAVAAAAAQDPGSGSSVPGLSAGAGMLLIGSGSIWNVLNHVPDAQHLVADPWNIEQVMPYVRDFNSELRRQLAEKSGAR